LFSENKRMSTYTTEIASDQIPSDNPIHQRLLKAYIAAAPYIQGNLLELGCGEGRGVEWLAPKATAYTAIDKIQEVIDRLRAKFPGVQFMQAHIPPLPTAMEGQFDTIVSFQVIEHIKNDRLFLQEIYKALKPGGKAIISTPNINYTLSRNPWHEREYTPEQLSILCKDIFDKVESKGIAGNEKVMRYHEENRASVQKIMRWDIFNLQYRLPASLLRVPYEILNRRNRNKLQQGDNELVLSISHEDYRLENDPNKSLDLFYILHKKS
jgi:2-polyprenyl-3-methyl-5-hydroxy-6-metoxy-1,4-benzoquinol methylase